MADEHGATNEHRATDETAEAPRARASNSELPIPAERPEMGNTPLLLSLAPFALFAILYFVFPQYGGRTFDGAVPGGLPVPVRMFGLFIGLAWGGFGSFLVSESSSYSRAILALLACTIPASLLVVAAPGW